MLAGPFLIYLMVLMTKFRLSLKLASVSGLSNFCCMFLAVFPLTQRCGTDDSFVYYWLMYDYGFTDLEFFHSHPSPTVLVPALRTIGNIVTGDDAQTQVFIITKSSHCCTFSFCLFWTMFSVHVNSAPIPALLSFLTGIW